MQLDQKHYVQIMPAQWKFTLCTITVVKSFVQFPHTVTIMAATLHVLVFIILLTWSNESTIKKRMTYMVLTHNSSNAHHIATM